MNVIWCWRWIREAAVCDCRGGTAVGSEKIGTALDILQFLPPDAASLDRKKDMRSYVNVVVRPESVDLTKHGLLTVVLYHDPRKSVSRLNFMHIYQCIFIVRCWY